MMPKYPTSVSVLSLGAALLLAVMGAFGFVLEGISAAEASVTSAQSITASSAEAAVLLQKKVQLAAEIQSSTPALNALAIKKGGDADFISQIENTAAALHLAAGVSSVQTLPPSAAGAPGTLKLSLTSSGSYSDCMQFLQLLETMPTALSISSVTLVFDGKAWQESIELSVASFDSP